MVSVTRDATVSGSAATSSGAASRMRPALASSAATASSGADASGSVRGSFAPPPPEKRKLPGSPRRCATRSGNAAASSAAGSPSAAAPVRRRRRYCAAACRIRDTAPRSAAAAPPRNASRRRPISADASALRSGSALLQQGRQLGSQRRLRLAPRRHHHGSEPGMRAKPRHVPSPGRQAALRVQRAQVGQQRPRRGQRPGRRWVRERQSAGRSAPGRAVQHQAGQLRLQYLRPVERCQAAVLRRGPQPDRHARRLPPRPASPLVGGGAADPQRGQTGQAGGGVQAWRTPPAAIHHHAHPRHRQAGLRDAGRQHHAPRPVTPQRRILLGQRQVAVQRQHRRAASRKFGLRAAYLTHAGQERQDAAVMLRQGGADGAGGGARQVAQILDVARGVPRLDREHAPGALDHDGIHQRRQPGAVGRGAHCHQPQLRPQLALQVQAQRQRQVRAQRPLVHLVQHHAGDAVQPGIGVQPPHQQPLRHHLDPGRVGHRGIQPGAVAAGAPHDFAPQPGHACGCGAGRQAPRLQHQDAPVPAPGLAQQRKRNKRGLARAGRRNQHGVRPARQRGHQAWQRLRNGQVGQRVGHGHP